jgi:hypothetical protein
MPSEWCEEFQQALLRRNITRLRILGEEAHGVDPLLSDWIVERARQYDLEGLIMLTEVSE